MSNFRSIPLGGAASRGSAIFGRSAGAGITPEPDGSLAVRTPYHPGFVADLKTLPATDRRFDGQRKVWVVTPAHGQAVADMILRHFGQLVEVPVVTPVQARPEMRTLDVRYIGAAKDRGNGERVAFGWAEGAWSVLLPEDVLRDWFGQERQPDEHVTLYGVLGIRQGANDADIKTAYRRMAKQWHPDVSKEPGTAEQFRAIQHAYDILREPRQRKKYDAGLKLSARTEPIRDDIFQQRGAEYRSPLRCGLLLAEGMLKLGKFQVSRIAAWNDIVDAQGRSLVTSWPMGADAFVEEWL